MIEDVRSRVADQEPGEAQGHALFVVYPFWTATQSGLPGAEKHGLARGVEENSLPSTVRLSDAHLLGGIAEMGGERLWREVLIAAA
jgi:hypothetical protein